MEPNEQQPVEDTMPEAPEVVQEERKEEGSPVGPIIGVIIIVIVLVVGGLYFWGANLVKQQENEAARMEAKENAAEDNLPEDVASSENVAAEIEQINQQSSSNDLSDIEADLNATDLSNIDAELESIDEALNF